MGLIKNSLQRIPNWAYLLVLLVIAVNTINLIYQYQFPRSGEHFSLNNEFYIIDFIGEDTPVSRTEIKLRDTIVSCNGIPIQEWISYYHGQVAGDTLIFGILRNNMEIGIPVIEDSYFSEGAVYMWASYLVSILVSIGSMFLLILRPEAKEVKLFFIYLLLLAFVSAQPNFLPFPLLLPVLARSLFPVVASLYGAVLIHFHLVFPRRALILKKFRQLPLVFYGTGTVFSAFLLVSFFRWVYFPSEDSNEYFNTTIRVSLFSTTAFFAIALGIAIYQYVTIKNTLARNQLLLLLTGSFFVFLPLFVLAFFYDWVSGIPWPFTFEVASATGNLILVTCILIAIFRYRIWNVEVAIRKALLYISATVIIILVYFSLIWVVDRLLTHETNLSRFLILAVSVTVFLLLRDRLQRLIDRIFYRETYDSASVVSEFESKLAGIYKLDELASKIVQSLDEIFHFKNVVFSLRKTGLVYCPVYFQGIGDVPGDPEFTVTQEFDERLRKSKVFAPAELVNPAVLPGIPDEELIVPVTKDHEPKGFFLCGQKKSERIYSQQDIRILSLLAQRVIALLHTASLYEKDLDRKLELERERARISQDMHDDVGASLTRISILSELAKNKADTDKETRQWLEQISSTSRSVTEEMSQIVWALNPKNDTLEGLVAYIRRFANEFLEPTSIHCSFKLPETIHHIPLSVEIRRNIYLIVREALHNVVKHSGATEVVITLSPSLPATPMTSPLNPLSLKERGRKGERSLILSIRDNGKGFNPDNLEFPGNGLVNMKKRMKDIRGTFNITSVMGEGTIIEIST